MTVEAPARPVPTKEIASHAAEVDRNGRFPTESVEALRRDGLLGLGVGPDYGGPGGTPVEVVQSTADHERFRELLLPMDAADPFLCEPMELEYVNRWVEADESGYGDLIEAVRRGPIVVGSTPEELEARR